MTDGLFRRRKLEADKTESRLTAERTFDEVRLPTLISFLHPNLIHALAFGLYQLTVAEGTMEAEVERWRRQLNSELKSILLQIADAHISQFEQVVIILISEM